jgi:hypothetical protein
MEAKHLTEEKAKYDLSKITVDKASSSIILIIKPDKHCIAGVEV